VRIAGVAIACCAVLAIPSPAAAVTHDWARFGFDAARSNMSSAYAGIGAGDLAHLVRQDVTVPGTVDSSPLYLHDVPVKGRMRDAFFASTTYGRVFALDADSGAVLWTYTPASYADLFPGGQFQASSPVADRKRGFIYATSPDGLIHKLSLAGGREVLTDSWPVPVTLDAHHEKMSSPLNISGRWVIMTTASYDDNKPYVGHVALVNRWTGELEHVFNAICPKSHELISAADCKQGVGAGIWARSGAVVIPKSHRLLVTTGNSKWNGTTNFGDTVLELSPDATRVLDTWTPRNQSAMDAFDLDLGSTAPALMRSGKRLLGVQGGKDGLLRLLDVDDLNGHGGACACTTDALRTYHPKRSGIFTTPAIWRHRGASWAFVATYYGTLAYRLTKAEHPKLHHEWRADVGGSSPVIAGGLLYVYDPFGHGVAVYRPASGKLLATLPAARGHWNSPIVADGRVAVPTGSVNDHAATAVFTIYRKP
jgi:hypothetical protein